MPIIRKIIQLGTSKAVSLPKTWLDWIKREYGIEVTEVAMEVNHVIILQPVIPKSEGQKKALGITSGG